MAELARRQHGVVSRNQLLEMGIGRGAIDSWVATGRLHPIHPGVYAVGHSCFSQHGYWLAAVLATGPGSVLSHRSAAALWELDESPMPRIEVTTSRGRHRTAAIIAHRTRGIDLADTTIVGGIPTTAVARTLLDCADVVGQRRLDGAWEESQRRGLLKLNEVDAVLDRARGRHGHARIAELLAREATRTGSTRSELERLFVRLCADAELPLPLLNHRIGRFTVDAYWPAHGLVVELDGWAFHGGRKRFEADHRRDAALQRSGHLIVQRFTYEQVAEDGPGTVATIAALLSRGGMSAVG